MLRNSLVSGGAKRRPLQPVVHYDEDSC